MAAQPSSSGEARGFRGGARARTERQPTVLAAAEALRAEVLACAAARERAQVWRVQIASATAQLQQSQGQLRAEAARQERRVQGLLRAGGRRPGAAAAGDAPSSSAAAGDAPSAAAAAGEAEVAPNVRRAFELFDANKSGSLDALELRQALVQLGLTEATNHQARNPNPNREPEPQPEPQPQPQP
mgnify:CR=1 FL=1